MNPSDAKPNRLRICRIQSRICVGGPTRHTLLLSTHLDPERYETILIGGGLQAGEKDMLPLARDLGVRTYHLPEMRRPVNPLRDLHAFQRLCRIFTKEKPVIVHTHTAKAGAIGRVAARACGVPIVVHTFHGHVLRGYFPDEIAAAFRVTERMLARMTDRIIVISESQKRELQEEHRIAPQEKFRVIPLGLELDRFLDLASHRGQLREELNVPPASPLVGWVGRLTEIKDPSLFLRAFAQMGNPRSGRTHPIAPHLVLVGDGHLRARLEEEARDLGIAERAHFLGYRDDLERIYADLTLLVLTSRNEGTPVTVIEGMTAGLPIIATRVGGMADTVQGYPLADLVPPGDAAALASRMERSLAIRIPSVDGMPAFLRFGARRLLDDIEALYEEMLEERGLAGGSAWPRQGEDEDRTRQAA